MIQSKNFLINPKIADFIVKAAELRPEDIVLEIGAGKGILTKRILEKCKVYAIEIDPQLCEYLQVSLSPYIDEGKLKRPIPGIMCQA